MTEFEKLLDVANTLLGPNGCPWDKKQTFQSLQKYLIEESHELLEAIDEENPQEICEELGDVFYVLIFICMIAEKKKYFTIHDVFSHESKKLIHRHPHIFGDTQAESIEEIWQVWDAMKKKEQGKKGRRSQLDGIPANLPLLLRAQKFFQKTRKNAPAVASGKLPFKSEEELGEELLQVLERAEDAQFDAESALRRALTRAEKNFRKKEKTTGDGLET